MCDITSPFAHCIDEYAQLGPEEDASLSELVRTDNAVLNKVVVALSTLCVEVRLLEREAHERFFPALLLYGERLLPSFSLVIAYLFLISNQKGNYEIFYWKEFANSSLCIIHLKIFTNHTFQFLSGERFASTR